MIDFVLKAMGVIGTLSLAVAIFFVWYWGVFDRASPLHIRDQARTFVDYASDPITEARAGSYVYIKQSYCHDSVDGPAEENQNGRGYPGVVHLKVLNHDVERLPSKPNLGVSGCWEDRLFRQQVPSHLEGTYKFLYSIEHFRNPLQYLIGGVPTPFPPLTLTVTQNAS